ncbi:MAG: hypothetical protein ACM3TR_19760 [Caulobacteraceae bacterium]
MHSNSFYSYNQPPYTGSKQYTPAPEGGTTYGYPITPQAYPTQQQAQQIQTPQIGAQPTAGQQIPVMPPSYHVPITGAGPVDFDMLPSTPVMDVEFTQGYLRTQIGARIKVEFLIGTDMLVDREGTLVNVGIAYIIIREVDTDDLLLCDIYSIKFVRFYQ